MEKNILYLSLLLYRFERIIGDFGLYGILSLDLGTATHSIVALSSCELASELRSKRSSSRGRSFLLFPSSKMGAIRNVVNLSRKAKSHWYMRQKIRLRRLLQLLAGFVVEVGVFSWFQINLTNIVHLIQSKNKKNKRLSQELSHFNPIEYRGRSFWILRAIFLTAARLVKWVLLTQDDR